MSELHWTAADPTVAGYYWAKPREPYKIGGRDVGPVIVEVRQDGRSGKYTATLPWLDETLWAGPLVPPDDPVNHGPCPVCGKDVVGDGEHYTNATEHDGKALHEECARKHCE